MYYRYWMHMAHGHNNPAHFGIRSERYKLIFYYGTDYSGVHAGRAVEKHGGNRFWADTPAAWELYDLERDPTEMHNRYADPACAATVAEMKDDLRHMRQRLGDTDDAYPRIRRVITEHWDD